MLINRFFSLFLSVCPHFFCVPEVCFWKKLISPQCCLLFESARQNTCILSTPGAIFFLVFFFLMVNLSLFLYHLTANYQIVNQFTHSAQKSIHNWHVSKKSRSQVQIVAAGLLCVSFQCLVCGFWFTSARAPLPAYQYNCVSGECVCVYVECIYSVHIVFLSFVLFYWCFSNWEIATHKTRE